MRKKRKRKPTGPPMAVIEEDADDIYSIKFILQSLGHDVRSYSYLHDYMADMIDFAPKVVIVDMMIPEGGGFQAIRQVKRHLPDVPVLAITADAMEGSEKEVLEAGGEDTLGKPYTVGDLQDKLGQWIAIEKAEG
ncbi:MAG TPA: response regulator [Acidobacteriota bacterium]|nr:response regulator [Acidobacteriota bacterium]